jgi:flagellar biosynthesis protein FliQ
MTCLIQFIACLGLIIMGLAVLVGVVKPDEALRRIGIFLALLLIAPAIVAALVKGLIFPVAIAAWSAAKSLLTFAVIVVALLLIAWVGAEIVELCRNRNSGEQRVHSGEE